VAEGSEEMIAVSVTSFVSVGSGAAGFGRWPDPHESQLCVFARCSSFRSVSYTAGQTPTTCSIPSGSVSCLAQSTVTTTLDAGLFNKPRSVSKGGGARPLLECVWFNKLTAGFEGRLGLVFLAVRCWVCVPYDLVLRWPLQKAHGRFRREGGSIAVRFDTSLGLAWQARAYTTGSQTIETTT
jgi:hypothetical protein